MNHFDSYDQFRAAILDLIALRRERLDALALPDPDLEATLEDLETEYVELIDRTSAAEQAAIGDFYQAAMEVFGSNEELFDQYPDAAGLLYALRIEGARSLMLEQVRACRGKLARSNALLDCDSLSLNLSICPKVFVSL
jgi:hypothetical protein